MRRIRYNKLPDDWTVPERLSQCEIFVFESTLEGEHTEGNAKIAYERFGAEWGVGAGRTGQTYAIPTNFMCVEEDFEPFVQDFIEYVKAHPDNRFILPRMECKGAEFYEKDIIPLFEECFDLPNVQMSHAWNMRIITLRTIDAMADGYVENDVPESPKVMDEEVLSNLCLKYRYQIGSGVNSHVPKVRIRYVIDRNLFGYVSFGEFFMIESHGYYDLYVWMQDDKYAELHNQDIVEEYFAFLNSSVRTLKRSSGVEHFCNAEKNSLLSNSFSSIFSHSLAYSVLVRAIYPLKIHFSPSWA